MSALRRWLREERAAARRAVFEEMVASPLLGVTGQPWHFLSWGGGGPPTLIEEAHRLAAEGGTYSNVLNEQPPLGLRAEVVAFMAETRREMERERERWASVWQDEPAGARPNDGHPLDGELDPSFRKTVRVKAMGAISEGALVALTPLGAKEVRPPQVIDTEASEWHRHEVRRGPGFERRFIDGVELDEPEDGCE